MSGVNRLIDFKGHARRGEYWAISMCAGFASFILTALAAAAPDSVLMGVFVLAAILLVVLPIHVAAAVRRLHDRGKSGWWAVLFIGTPFTFSLFSSFLTQAGTMNSPPALVGIFVLLGVVAWAFAELGILPGKTKGNRYLGMSDGKLAAAFD